MPVTCLTLWKWCRPFGWYRPHMVPLLMVVPPSVVAALVLVPLCSRAARWSEGGALMCCRRVVMYLRLS